MSSPIEKIVTNALMIISYISILPPGNKNRMVAYNDYCFFLLKINLITGPESP